MFTNCISSCRLDRRGFASFLSKQFKKVSRVFVFIASVLTANWKLKQAQPKPLFVPEATASAVPDVSTATEVVVSAEGTAVMTFKPTPDPTSLQG